MAIEKFMAPQLLVIGSLNVDTFLEIKRLPHIGETIATTTRTNVRPGGKGANQAVAAARYLEDVTNKNVKIIGQVGDDLYNKFFNNYLGANVDKSLIRTAKGISTGQAYILKTEDGDNSIIIVGGANMEGWEMTNDIKLSIESSSGILLQCEIPDEINLAVAMHAKSRNIPVFMDVGGQERNLDHILPYISHICPNSTELSRMTGGMPTTTIKDATKAAEILRSKGAENILVTLGTQGSILLEKDGKVHYQPSYSVEKVLDSTGAGDCFRAVFAASLVTQKSSVQESLKAAAAAAALCVQSSGAMESMPTGRSVLELLNSSSPM